MILRISLEWANRRNIIFQEIDTKIYSITSIADVFRMTWYHTRNRRSWSMLAILNFHKLCARLPVQLIEHQLLWYVALHDFRGIPDFVTAGLRRPCLLSLSPVRSQNRTSWRYMVPWMKDRTEPERGRERERKREGSRKWNRKRKREKQDAATCTHLFVFRGTRTAYVSYMLWW